MTSRIFDVCRTAEIEDRPLDLQQPSGLFCPLASEPYPCRCCHTLRRVAPLVEEPQHGLRPDELLRSPTRPEGSPGGQTTQLSRPVARVTGTDITQSAHTPRPRAAIPFSLSAQYGHSELDSGGFANLAHWWRPRSHGGGRGHASALRAAIVPLPSAPLRSSRRPRARRRRSCRRWLAGVVTARQYQSCATRNVPLATRQWLYQMRTCWPARQLVVVWSSRSLSPYRSVARVPMRVP